MLPLGCSLWDSIIIDIKNSATTGTAVIRHFPSACALGRDARSLAWYARALGQCGCILGRNGSAMDQRAFALGKYAQALGICVAFTAGLVMPASAAPLLDMPAPATVIGGWAESPSTLRLPIGPFVAGVMPLQEAAGAVDQRAYRMDNQRLTTLQLITPLLAQLDHAGYKTIYQCETSACGGFDFRYGMDVLPEPQMHVDLGDFRYVAAMRPGTNGTELLALLVSRSADQGFVQITAITPLSAAAAAIAPPPTRKPLIQTGTDLALPDPAVADPAATDAAPTEPAATALAQKPPGDFGATLLAQGAVALDDLVFASGSAALENKDYASLTGLAAWLAANPTRHVTLVGHTDAVGTLQANTGLSRQRAQSVRASLIARFGAAGDQIDAQGAGYLAPRATNETPEGRTQNRRVEVILTPTL